MFNNIGDKMHMHHISKQKYIFKRRFRICIIHFLKTIRWNINLITITAQFISDVISNCYFLFYTQLYIEYKAWQTRPKFEYNELENSFYWWFVDKTSLYNKLILKKTSHARKFPKICINIHRNTTCICRSETLIFSETLISLAKD